jgi:hypothetical protein
MNLADLIFLYEEGYLSDEGIDYFAKLLRKENEAMEK